MVTLQGVLGLVVFVGIGVLLSEQRRAIRWRSVGIGVGVQLVLAVVLVKAPIVRDVLAWMSDAVRLIEEASLAGASFMFGYLAGGPTPFEVTDGGANFIVGFRVLPLILIVSAISAVLFHWGVLPWVIRGMAKGLQRVFKVSGALGFAAASSVFFGIIESPLLIKPYLGKLDRSELFALMTCGMATVAGTVMVLYASVLSPIVPEAMGHILVASVISVPAALVMSHLFIPGDAEGAGVDAEITLPTEPHGTMGALMNGTVEGTKMVVHIAATIIVLFALVHLLNRGLGLVPSWDDGPVTAQKLIGTALRPMVWLLGIPWEETATAGELVGTKTILNEFVAYLDMARLPAGALSERSRLIMTYAMCGFANLGSLGILVGGLGAIVPERRPEIITLGFRAILAGTLATFMTGAVIGLLT